MLNLNYLFVLCTASQIIGGDFAKFCGLLRIYEIYYKIFSKMGAESLVSVLHNAQAPIRSRVGMEIEANAE